MVAVTDGRVMIDSHIHLWRAQDGHRIWVRDAIAALDRDFTLADFTAAALNVSGVVVVEAASTSCETLDLASHLGGELLVEGIVGWANLEEASVPALLDRYATLPLVKGVRVQPVFGGRAGWVPSAALLRGVRELAARGLSLDLLVGPGQLDAAGALTQGVPEISLMINHCGRPLTMCGPSAEWTAGVRRLARESGACCKLSGLVERAGFEWTAETLAPFVATLLEAFGPERLAFASNWPMLTLLATWRRWVEALDTLLARLGVEASGRDAIFADTARRFYRLTALRSRQA